MIATSPQATRTHHLRAVLDRIFIADEAHDDLATGPRRAEAEDAPLIVQVERDTIFPVVRSATPRERTRRSYLTVVAVGLDPALVAAELSPFVIGVVDGF